MQENNYDIKLFGKRIDPDYCDLKVYQDLLTYSFIIQNIKPGSKILEVGGGKSRILEHFKNDYECWNLDKFEGLGNGPLEFEPDVIKTVVDLAGNFNKELKDEYFDLVFSISALEHSPISDFVTYKNILTDMNRVLKKGGYSLHTIDQCAEDISGFEDAEDLVVWTNPVIEYFAMNQKTVNEFIPLLDVMKDPEIYGMSEKYYAENWQKVTGKSYFEFGMPFSYNFLWIKE
ncbi:MAG: methyltransferase domain-containing protein [Ignavibacteria bacterium]|nr:methyltransferase domain-containing protein [Ignavibacteria bacterium]